MVKKLSILLLTIMMMVMLTGCGEDILKEDVIASSTCTKQNEDYHETLTVMATNDEINNVELTFVYENSLFGVDTLSTLDETQKEQVKANMLTNLGLESSTYEGFEVVIDIQDKMTVTIKADLTKADSEVLKKVGLDFSNTNMSYEDAVKSLEAEDYSCIGN